jgi:hypothetical protein
MPLFGPELPRHVMESLSEWDHHALKIIGMRSRPHRYPEGLLKWSRQR